MNDLTLVASDRKIDVDKAMRSFAQSYSALSALRLESCIHCGMCAEACHFYVATGDPKYTPILKAEPLKQAYKREAGPFAPFYRWLGFKRPVSESQLDEWRHLIYESCNMCGRCSLICPMGIDVADLVREARRAMADAGLAPAELDERAVNQLTIGRPEPGDPYLAKLAAIGARFGVEVPVDLDQADVYLCIPRTDIEHYPKTVAALVKIMAHMGVKATLRSDALLADNYGYYTGSRKQQWDIARTVIEQAVRCHAKTLVIPECRHAYTVLRWEAADIYGAPLPFEVKDTTEFLAEQLEAGRLKLNKASPASVAFHDPCQLVKRHDVRNAARVLMAAMELDLHEMPNNRQYSYCCGGGGGVFEQEAARQLRYRAQQMKLREIDGTGADTFMTSCSGCRLSFADAGTHFNWDKSPQSLLEMVAENLVEE